MQIELIFQKKDEIRQMSTRVSKFFLSAIPFGTIARPRMTLAVGGTLYTMLIIIYDFQYIIDIFTSIKIYTVIMSMPVYI